MSLICLAGLESSVGCWPGCGVEARDAENAMLRAELAASLDRERRLVLRVAELERRLGMDSSNSGMPTSKEPIGARQRRNAERRNRQASERERRKDRTRGGQPGHPGTGLARDPGPGERKSADPPAQCSRCRTALDGTQSAGSSWAQVWDVQISRLVTEWLLPMRECPCCGQVTTAAAPPRVHAGTISYGPAVNGIYEMVKRRGRQCGVQVYPHRFRHHFSHTWLDRGVGGRGLDGAERLEFAADAHPLRRQRPCRPRPPYLRPDHVRRPLNPGVAASSEDGSPATGRGNVATGMPAASTCCGLHVSLSRGSRSVCVVLSGPCAAVTLG